MGLRLDRIGASSRPRCPKCGEREKLNMKPLQYEFHWWCLACGEDWPGGCCVAQPDPASEPPVPGVPIERQPHMDPDEDRPLLQCLGADYRDPSKNFGPDDE